MAGLIHTTHPDDEHADTELSAQLLIDGRAPTRLEQLVARISHGLSKTGPSPAKSAQMRRS